MAGRRVKVERGFYARPTLEVAAALLGKHLVCRRGRSIRAARIVETEAYVGQADRACHARGGRTARNGTMYGPPGHAYVYFIYGMHHCLNLVTEAEGFPAAVLLRALEATAESEGLAMSGPGRLCRALGIDRGDDGADLCGDRIWVEDRGEPSAAIARGPRVGVDYAGQWAAKPWRFWIEGCAAVSGPRRTRRKR